MKIGMIDVTGDLSAYIEDAALKNKYRNEVDTEMQVTETDKATNGNAYRLTLPRERFTSAQDTQIAAFQQLEGVSLRPWQVLVIEQLDAFWRAEQQ